MALGLLSARCLTLAFKTWLSTDAKILTSNAIKLLKTWRSEWGQLDKLEVEIKEQQKGGASRLFS
jgi:hypothetical protein